LKQLVDVVFNYAPNSSFTIKIPHLEGEEIFGSCNGKQMPLRSEANSHKHDGFNYFHLCVNPQTNKWHEQPSSSVDQHNHMVFTIEGVEVLEITCGEEYGI
jgi:hypothetical protein